MMQKLSSPRALWLGTPEPSRCPGRAAASAALWTASSPCDGKGPRAELESRPQRSPGSWASHEDHGATRSLPTLTLGTAPTPFSIVLGNIFPNNIIQMSLFLKNNGWFFFFFFDQGPSTVHYRKL